MCRPGRCLIGVLTAVALCAIGRPGAPNAARAAQVLMKDGRILEGKLGAVASLGDVPKITDPDGVGPIRMILFLDDDLRRTFVPKRQRLEVRQDNPGQVEERFHIRKAVARGGRKVKSVGPVMDVKPFDEFGWRTFRFNTPRGPVDVIQGITLITPKWTKVEGKTHVWDSRWATSSIPSDVLHKILMRQVDPTNVEDYKKIARFYNQSERYKQAREILEAIVKTFPDKPDLAENLEPTIRAIRQLSAQRLLQELKLRGRAGQDRMVYQKLKEFPSEGVAGEILQAVREMIQQYDQRLARGKEIVQQLDTLLEQVQDADVRKQIEPIRREMLAESSIHTLDRMAAFRQGIDDQAMTPEDKLSLAISGWLLGADQATEKLPVALSVYQVRDLVRQYVNEPVKLARARIFALLETEEGAQPRTVAAMLAHMKPPGELPEPVSSSQPGLYRLQVEGLPNGPPVDYLVQIPPEYDPYRRYPAIVTLQGAGTTATHQVDWWAGAWAPGGWRAGQATRYGYIVIAPEWTVEHQTKYGYSAREHAAVLNSLRDACRRFAIDTDRVFLSGHSMGGDAAWDIGLAHPDLWAGVIPIVAKSDRYIAHYKENAERLPMYFVCGELDGSKLSKNARDLDRYMKAGYNCTVVEYLGRGHEHFSDEILRIFDWMDRFRRDFYPREFTCATMRRWDNFFWWVELQGLPPRAMVEPDDWPPPRGSRAATVTARIMDNNGLSVNPGTGQVTVWISPEMISFDQRVNIIINGRPFNTRDRFVRPDLTTMLEDARTRGDRQHPFWAKVVAPTGRVVGSR